LLDSLRVRDGRYLEDLREYLDGALKVEGVVLVVVFGSLSRGLAKPYPESDIDILVVARDLPGELAKRRSHTLGVRRRPPGGGGSLAHTRGAPGGHKGGDGGSSSTP
jgi:hypothetical protein